MTVTRVRSRQPVVLPHDEVHVWHVGLQPRASDMASLQGMLSATECERAARFRFDVDRDLYIVARSWLRRILSSYLGGEPGEIAFDHNSHGKPCVAGPADRHALRFNVAHSGDLALYAVTRAREVGVDLERRRQVAWRAHVAQQFLSPTDVAVLATLPPEVRDEAFLTCWTRNEAYLKARGGGFSLKAEDGDNERWTVRPLAVGPRYVAALVVQGSGWRLRRWSTA